MKVLNSLALLLLAIVLAILLIPIGFVLQSMFPMYWEPRYKYRYKCARAIDQLGNAVGWLLFSLLFVNPRKEYMLHWDEDHTVSYVLAKNHKDNLTTLGLWLYNLLEKLDPWHWEKAIADEEVIYS